MHRNISVIRNVVKAMTPFRSDAIVLVVSNPVDLLTSIAQELAGLPKFQVFGSGTFLDSVRLRGLLADKAGVRIHTLAPTSVEARFCRQYVANYCCN
jgi:L-lactate dehydrogenase